MPTELNQSDVILFGTILLSVVIALVAILFIGAWTQRRYSSASPYTAAPLRHASDLPYWSARQILQFLYDQHQYDNRIFSLKKSAVCRETGRIFPNCINWLGTMDVDWNFLKKRYPGSYVSWGSLSEQQQLMIRDAHETLEGFQTERSSSQSAPSDIETKYVYVKPGPLYVDLQTKVLLGWKCVPETDFEVLIVQKPKHR